MIYTTGYSGKNIDDLKPLLARLDARLVDIRFSPPDSPLRWSKSYLQLLLKRSYQHLPALGLREVRPGRSGIQNLTLGLRVLGEENYNVLLMCECGNFESCHRKIISQELIKLGKETEEVEKW